MPDPAVINASPLIDELIAVGMHVSGALLERALQLAGER